MHLTKRLLGTLVLAFMLTGMLATFGIADPGPNGNNDKGLCTAYFNGQKKGHEKQQERNGEYPGPFQALQDHAEDHEDNPGYTGEEAVYWYCMFAEDGPRSIGGNPDQSGRWSCEGETEDDVSCEENDAPGNSGNNGNGG